ncbi:MAG: glycosyltransferase [Clostridia bacterium]|nr:glycosyltransferase [Clostridia bacterium]
MSKYKICVYAIAKNEEKFASRWTQSMSEADEIIVLDTGSEDKTVEILSSFPKVKVYSETVSPWRFDTARNLSLSKVPEDADYCVCTDLDEVFREGWREAMEKAFDASPDILNYRYTWSFNPDGSENTVFNIEKTHKRHGFSWTHPVHEVLTFEGKGTAKRIFAEGVQLNHYPDTEKSRGQYLPLLELSVKEKPDDDRNVHYLGREYMYYGKYKEAIETLKLHLTLKNATWADERCASMRYIARCYEALGEKQQSFLWLLKASAEAPHLREPWLQTAEFLYKEKNWHGVITFINKALEINNRTDTYISDAAAWGEKPYDLLSIAYYYTGDIKKATENAEAALKFTPENERIKANLDFYKNISA